MLNAIDVANFFIYLNKNENNNKLTNRFLNHLLYFAEGWYFSKNENCLFDEQIANINNQPIVKSVFDHFSKYNNNPINELDTSFDISKFVSSEIEILIAVYEYYIQLDIEHLNNIFVNNFLVVKDSLNLVNKNNLKNFFLERKYFDDLI